MEKKQEFYLHSVMCLIGGFLGAYAILNRGGNLGSAQTANLIYIVLFILGRNITDLLLRLAGMALYFIAIVLFVLLSKKTSISMQRYSIAVDCAGAFLLCLIPADANPALGIMPIFFMMATQWSVFHGTNGYNSSTIFSTNNFRQMTLGISSYMMEKDQEQLDKARFFANSLIWYHIGVAAAFFACLQFGIYACLFCILPCVGAFVLTCIELPQLEDAAMQAEGRLETVAFQAEERIETAAMQAEGKIENAARQAEQRVEDVPSLTGQNLCD